jgi:iron-sulfur cluster assembly protein
MGRERDRNLLPDAKVHVDARRCPAAGSRIARTAGTRTGFEPFDPARIDQNCVFDMVISMTDRAADQIRTVADEEKVSLDDVMLRVAVVPGGCSGLTYDLGWDTTVQEEDTVEVHNGITIVLDKRSRLYLDGTELDFTDGLKGDGFHFSNPQASRTCACGESFGV